MHPFPYFSIAIFYSHLLWQSFLSYALRLSLILELLVTTAFLIISSIIVVWIPGTNTFTFLFVASDGPITYVSFLFTLSTYLFLVTCSICWSKERNRSRDRKKEKWLHKLPMRKHLKTQDGLRDKKFVGSRWQKGSLAGWQTADWKNPFLSPSISHGDTPTHPHTHNLKHTHQHTTPTHPHPHHPHYNTPSLPTNSEGMSVGVYT